MAIHRISGSPPRSFWLGTLPGFDTLVTVYAKKGVYIVPEGQYVIIPEHGDWSDNDPTVKHRFEAGTTFQVVNGGSPYTLAVTDVTVSAEPIIEIEQASALFKKEIVGHYGKVVESSFELFDHLMAAVSILLSLGEAKFMEFKTKSVRYPDKGTESRRVIAVRGTVPLKISPEELEELSVLMFEQLNATTSQPFTLLNIKNGQLV